MLHTKEDGEIIAERVLAATGRRMALDDLHLDRAGVKCTDKGVVVDK